MTAIILHLTDIHIRSENDVILARGPEIASAVFPYLPEATIVLIVISGDIVFSGKSIEYEAAKNFIASVRNRIRDESDAPVRVFAAPGNHDCNFDLNNAARSAVLKQLIDDADAEVDDSVIEVCTAVQCEFFRFRDAVDRFDDQFGDKLRWVTRLKIEGKTVAIDCLNVSWTSQLYEDPGRLYFPVHRYSERQLEDVDVRLVVLHHPLNWFAQSIYRPFRAFVRKGASIVISGHEHQGTFGTLKDAETESSAYVEGCVLQGEANLADSSFNVIVVDLPNSQFLAVRDRVPRRGVREVALVRSGRVLSS